MWIRQVGQNNRYTMQLPLLMRFVLRAGLVSGHGQESSQKIWGFLLVVVRSARAWARTAATVASMCWLLFSLQTLQPRSLLSAAVASMWAAKIGSPSWVSLCSWAAW